MDLTAALEAAEQILSAEHREELMIDSCIDPHVVRARGYRTLTGTADERQELEDLGFKRTLWDRDTAYPMLLIPMHGRDGSVRGHQVKPAIPRTRTKEDGTVVPIKYETPPRTPSVVDVPAFTRSRLDDTSGDLASIWVTEGMKKTDCLVSRGMAALGLAGVWNWRREHGALGDWEDIPLKGRAVVICFDSDTSGNRHVQLAMGRFGAWLRTRGATVKYLVVPAMCGDTPVKGVDDWFAAGGNMADLAAAATDKAPGSGEKDASFTDAFLVEELAEAMEGRFCWASGLGWLRWSGRTWKEVSEVEPLEAVRQWTSEQFEKACDEQKRNPSQPLGPKVAGWRSLLNKGRLTALRDLSKGLLQRDAAEFDGDPDLLTVLNGTLHLPTGRLLDFDPEHCITKSCDAEYRRGYTHPMWTASLRAIPADLHEWYRDRLGQALTGYPTPDHTLVIGCGTGANGKSTIANTVRRTLGGYGVLVSDRVLMANPDAHPTELMDLRGTRYAILEETPEARHLNVQRLKTVLGAETIRARRIRMDTVEFLATHSLFINTNYRPTVTETDWGTWRRLALMTFPFTFRKPGHALESRWDRAGDTALAYSSNDPEVRAAALAWMAEGAREWYARGRMMLPHPETVERHTREWRAETDLILGFADEMLRFDPDAFTQTRDMLAAFNDWSGERGHRPWNDRTFATRFGDHDTVRGAKVKQGRFTVGGKQQRGWAGVEIDKGGRNPWTGEPDEPPAPEPPYSVEFWSGTDPSAPDPGVPGMVVTRLDECGNAVPPTTARELVEPVTLGFDLETASAAELFTGRHEGPFVRLGGWKSEASEAVTANASLISHTLDVADVIYGHNIFGFDLLALAHHHGADYDALAAKAWDLQVAETLVNPPLSKGMPKGTYSLDGMAAKYGVAGKTDDLAKLAKAHGGYDRIPLDDPDYHAYLRGDLVATKAVHDAQLDRIKELGLEDYASREMAVAALQNRITLNGWAVDAELLAERVAQEDAKRAEAVRVLHEEYGVPLARPDRFKLLPRAEWPEEYQGRSVVSMREELADYPDLLVGAGCAVRIPGEVYASPWATDAGRDAIVAAFAAAGAEHYPTTAKSGQLMTSADALGEKDWYCPVRRESFPGLLHPDVYGSNDAVRAIVGVLGHATGARVKYAELAPHVTAQGRVHPQVGQAQGSGRWAYVKPSTSTMGKRGAAKAERDVMVADPGHVMLTSDHSQLDVRTVAALSQDPELIAMLQPGMDYHTAMAQVYFGDPERRDDGKPISHGTNYGQGARAIALRNGLQEAMVQAALDSRGDKFHVLVGWTNGIRRQAEAGLLLDNGFGRPMRPDPGRAFTQAPALMGQGASRDVMCESLLRLDRLSGGRVRPFLRGVIHDEIVLSVPEAEAAEWQEMLREAMTWEWRGVPILCDVSAPAYRWSECK